jgi:formylglycine-generating enzyme
MKLHLKPYAERRDHQQLGRRRLGLLVVSLFAALTVFATGAEPITPGELVAPKLEIVGGNLNFTIQPSVAGRSYLLQYADTLEGGTWQDLGSAVIGDGNNLVITTPHAAGVPRRFYRLALDAPAVPEGFSFIPAGAFTMGRTSGDTDSVAPPVTVMVSAFFMGKYEVTKALWDEVRTWGAANGYTDLREGGGKASNHPVQSISWFDMVKWCNARSQRDGLTPVYTVSGAVMKIGTTAPAANWKANGYRLPTEAEWEKAARGGVSGKRFPSGSDTISHSQANYYASSGYAYDSSGAVNNSHPSYTAGGSPYTSPVGSFAANGYGLHDMAGNVWEWCWDWYGESTYVSGASDPRGADSGTRRVFRGSSWDYYAHGCRAAGRFNGSPASAGNGFGFRLARNSVPEEFSRIPAGAFTMGRTSGDTDPDAPPVTVTVSAFFMGKYEVTKALWDEVRTWGATNGYTDLRVGDGKASDHPVQTISWFDMVKWCNARSQKDGLTPVYTVSGAVMKTGTTAPTANWTAKGYRLPTEAEWEKAARGGVSGKRFPSGSDTISHSQANYYAASGLSYDLSGEVNGYHPTYRTGWEPYTSPVGSFAANWYGLHDMAGNVWEWCWDWYGGSTYVSGASDPRGAASGSKRVVRGGGWSWYATVCRVAYRDNGTPADPGNFVIGFRLARSSGP